MFFTKGVGRHKDYLQSFDLALRDAKIEKCNLVTVSSIYPAGCKRIPAEEGLKMLQAGQITFAVMARNATNEPNRLIAASLGVATPADNSQYGYLSEHHPFGETDEKAGEYAEDLAATMLATTLGVEFNPDTAWDEREKIYKMSGKIGKADGVTLSVVGDRNALWTAVVARAVLFPKHPRNRSLSSLPFR